MANKPKFLMKINHLDKTPFQFPEELNELTARQLEIVIGFIHQNLEIKTAKFKIMNAFFYHNWAMLWLFFKNDTLIPFLDWVTFRVFTWTQKILGEESLIDMIYSASSFLFESENYLTKQLYPYLIIKLPKGFLTRKIKLYGPSSELIGITFKEFIVADFQYRMFTKTREEKHLNKLCAVLYRPLNQAFTDDDSIDLRAALIQDIPLVRKLAIFQFYDGCYKQLVENHPHLFPKPKPKEGEKKTEVTITEIIKGYEMWKSVPAEFSEKPDEVAKQEEVQLHTVIRFLDHKAMQNQKLKEQAERKK